MATMLDIRRRIKAVKNIEQVTKAMEMVAAAKLRRAQERVIASRPYAGAMESILKRLANQGQLDHPFLTRRNVSISCVVAITGDRGLCGSYNVNILRKLHSVRAGDGVQLKFVPVGKKARDFMRRRDYPVLAEFSPIGEEPKMSQARQIAGALIRLYEEGYVDEVTILYTEFVSALTQRAREMALLPIVPPTAQDGAKGGEYIFEPSPKAVLDSLLPKYVEVQVYQALLESKASEHGARMTAMGNATDNAQEMIEELTLEYNRERQTSITRELSEIVRGAEALKGG